MQSGTMVIVTIGTNTTEIVSCCVRRCTLDPTELLLTLCRCLDRGSVGTVKWSVGAAYQVTGLDELHIATALNHLAGNLVTKHHVAAGKAGATAHHVLVGSADVGGDHLHIRIGKRRTNQYIRGMANARIYEANAGYALKYKVNTM
eukprot:1159177-Pyramimonas_sp.AAC.1